MKRLLFFEKPGCKTNRYQKQMLTAAGVTFYARNLLAEPWTQHRLKAFFTELPFEQWFNPTAPKIKNGEIAIAELTEETALAAMLDDPLLIRRPLFELGNQRWCGFDRQQLEKKLAIELPPTLEFTENCSRSSGVSSCD